VDDLLSRLSGEASSPSLLSIQRNPCGRVRERGRLIPIAQLIRYAHCKFLGSKGSQIRIASATVGRPVPITEATRMQKLINSALAGLVLAGLSIGLAGCSEESSIKQQTTTKSPGGTTTESKETKIQQRGQNPPAP
jgi:hypothetical protein